MKLNYYIILISLAVLLSHQIRAEEEEAEEEDVPRSCHSYTFDLVINGLKTALKCLAGFKIRRITDYVTRAYCIIKCVLQEFGTIDGEGKFDPVASSFFFDESFPADVKDALIPVAQGCFPLAEQFDNRDYWCKTYSPFINCILKALIAAVLPFSINCYVSPVIGIFLDTLKNLAPDPILESSVEELKRVYNKRRGVYCLHHNCTTKYKMSKLKGATTMILYHKNMTEFARIVKTPYGFTNITTIIQQHQGQPSTNDNLIIGNNDTVGIESNNNTLCIDSIDSVCISKSGNDTLNIIIDDSPSSDIEESLVNTSNNTSLGDEDIPNIITEDDVKLINNDTFNIINSDEITNIDDNNSAPDFSTEKSQNTNNED